MELNAPTAGAFVRINCWGPVDTRAWISQHVHSRTKRNNVWYKMYWNES